MSRLLNVRSPHLPYLKGEKFNKEVYSLHLRLTHLFKDVGVQPYHLL